MAPARLENLIEVIKLDTNQNFGLCISKFVNFKPLFEIVESGHLGNADKIFLIEQVRFYQDRFNACKIFWLDATPHNIMIASHLEFVPIDFANLMTGTNAELYDFNERAALKIIKYIKSGVFFDR